MCGIIKGRETRMNSIEAVNIQSDHIMQDVYGFSKTNNLVSVGADCTMPDLSTPGCHHRSHQWHCTCGKTWNLAGMWSYCDSTQLWYRQAEHDHIFRKKEEGLLIVKWLINAHTNINGNCFTIQTMSSFSISGWAYMNQSRQEKWFVLRIWICIMTETVSHSLLWIIQYWKNKQYVIKSSFRTIWSSETQVIWYGRRGSGDSWFSRLFPCK
jgi:hypothetical protein